MSENQNTWRTFAYAFAGTANAYFLAAGYLPLMESLQVTALVLCAFMVVISRED